MLKAGALYFAVFLSFVIGIICTFFIWSSYLSNTFLSAEIQKDRLMTNVSSGITLLLNEPGTLPYNQSETFDLSGDQQDEIMLKKERWGFYDILTASAQWKKWNYTKVALAGEDIFKQEQVGLYLADKGKYLSVAGDTRITGTCYLPKMGIRRAYIKGEGYRGEKLIYGETRTSNKDLPDVNKSLIEAVEKYLEGTVNPSDSTVDFSMLYKEDSVIRSFQGKTLVYSSDKEIDLDNTTVKGKVILYSGKSIRISKGCRLDDVILIAPKIEIRPGFTGSIQAFAADSIGIGENCHLCYPGFIAIINKNLNSCIISVNKGSTIAGGILLYRDNKDVGDSKIIIDEGTRIYGQVYCSGVAELRGVITGSLYCSGFTLKTEAAYYENHLLNVKIGFEGLSRNFCGIPLLAVSENKRVIKWLD